jgi:hypothetical protein
MKKHKVLKYAYDNYPKGTKYRNLGCDNVISISSGVFYVDDYGVRDSKTNFFLLGTEDKWAEIVPEKPTPVLIGKSEDGVDIYNNSPLHTVWKQEGKWVFGMSYENFNTGSSITPEDDRRFFSTEESAIAWIKDQNKPKEVTVQLFNEFHSAKVTKDWIAFRVGKADSNTTTMIKPSDLEDMLHAYQSLNP